MATTTKGIPYPTGSDNNDAPEWLEAIADWLEDVFGAKTTAEIAALSGADLWAGRQIWDSDKGELYVYNGTGWVLAGAAVGSIMWSAEDSAEPGYLYADGTAVSRTTYAKLFAKIGTTYGSGDGSTTFNKPNLKARTVFGYDSGTTAFNAMGKTGGALTVTIASANLPTHVHSMASHTHTFSDSTNSAGAHTHTLSGTAASAGNHSHSINHNHPSASTSSQSSGLHSHQMNIPYNGAWHEVQALGGGPRVLAREQGTTVTETGTQTSEVSHSHTFNMPNYEGSSGSAGAHTHSVSGTANSAGNHSHTFSGTTDSGGSGNTGDGGFTNSALAILNPYITLYPMIKF